MLFRGIVIVAGLVFALAWADDGDQGSYWTPPCECHEYLEGELEPLQSAFPGICCQVAAMEYYYNTQKFGPVQGIADSEVCDGRGGFDCIPGLTNSLEEQGDGQGVAGGEEDCASVVGIEPQMRCYLADEKNRWRLVQSCYCEYRANQGCNISDCRDKREDIWNDLFYAQDLRVFCNQCPDGSSGNTIQANNGRKLANDYPIPNVDGNSIDVCAPFCIMTDHVELKKKSG